MKPSVPAGHTTSLTRGGAGAAVRVAAEVVGGAVVGGIEVVGGTEVVGASAVLAGVVAVVAPAVVIASAVVALLVNGGATTARTPSSLPIATAIAAAATATASAAAAGTAQPPGSRRLPSGSPHSMQISWLPATGEPQRGQKRGSLAIADGA